MYSWFQHIEFAYKSMFILLAFLPLMIYWYITGYNRWQGALLVSSISTFEQSGSWKRTFRHVLFALRLLAIACLIIALARPQTRNDEELKK